jgi:hypothetical protein
VCVCVCVCVCVSVSSLVMLLSDLNTLMRVFDYSFTFDHKIFE